MSIALGNMCAKFWKPLWMRFVRLVTDSRVLLYPEEVESVVFAAEAACLDEVVTRFENSLKNFRTIIKSANNIAKVIYNRVNVMKVLARNYYKRLFQLDNW